MNIIYMLSESEIAIYFNKNISQKSRVKMTYIFK